MSVYQKFIESSACSSQKAGSLASKCQHPKQHQPQASSSSSSHFANMLKPPMTISPIAAVLPSGLLKQPCSPYKRLVEIDIMQQRCQCRHKTRTSSFKESPQTTKIRNKCQQDPLQLLGTFFKTDDPVLIKWLQNLRYDTQLESLSSLQARTVAYDEIYAEALSIRNSHVTIQEMRLESNFTLDYIDYLIECLPVECDSIGRFSTEFSELWTMLVHQTAPKPINSATAIATISNKPTDHPVTIVNCTPKKRPQINAKSVRSLDELAIKVRGICSELARSLFDFQQLEPSQNCPSNGDLEAILRKLREVYGQFVEFTIKSECANIIRVLQQDFSINKMSSTASLHPVRPFESSSDHLPLKYALIALWSLTKDDSYLCRVLTEKWQTSADESEILRSQQALQLSPPRRIAKRLEFEHQPHQETSCSTSLSSEYGKLYQILPGGHLRNDENLRPHPSGALSSALRHKQTHVTKQISLVDILIKIIINQPNKHERLDMMNFIQSQAKTNKLIDLDEWDQSLSAAIFTSNQYKATALRILNQLCINDQAVKMILKSFSTPPPSPGKPPPENKIIRSIFECYQTSQEHIYQNEVMLRASNLGVQRGRKRTRQAQILEDEEYSDYGSRRTHSNQTPVSHQNQDTKEEEDASDDDTVVKEAIRLLIQLTNPFHRSTLGHDYYTLIGQFSINSLVKYLTSIIKSTTSRELLFLSLTTIANISFITTEPMVKYGTNGIMLEMFSSQGSRSRDLELRDQAVTILANTAGKNIIDVINNGGLTFLLSCLESCPTKMANYKQVLGRRDSQDSVSKLNIDNKPRDRKPIDFSHNLLEDLGCPCDQQMSGQTSLLPCLTQLSQTELGAMERIHQKAAIAFARMSVDHGTTEMVLEYGGVKQMVDLCRFSHKRNHSDTVLIACIAALRKMARVIKIDTFKHYHAEDLIDLELNQALEIYGSQQRMYASDV